MVTDIINTPEQARKKADETAQDTAYVINHAISCGITDTVTQPLVSALVQSRIEKSKLPGWTGKFFEPSNHGLDHSHNNGGHAPHPPGFIANAKHWLLGEAVGDLLAVPLTIIVQRTMPGLINLLRKVMEPVAGRYFRKGAEHSTRNWAIKHGVEPGSTEAKAKAEELYNTEIRRLPLAFIWNSFSIGINLATQKLAGNKASWGTLALGKTFGTLASNLMLLGGRGHEPAVFEKIDKFNSEHIITPATQAVGKLFGVDKKTSASVAEGHNNSEGKNWAERSQRPPGQNSEIR